MKRSDSQCVIVGFTSRFSFPTPSIRNTLGLPSSRCTSTHMPRLENPADFQHPHHDRCFTWTSSTLPLSSIETSSFSGQCQHFRITVIPVAYALLCVRFTCFVRNVYMPLTCTGEVTIRCSATGATLDTGGWLDLTRQGLPPCKVHQASLGALMPELSHAAFRVGWSGLLYAVYSLTERFSISDTN